MENSSVKRDGWFKTAVSVLIALIAILSAGVASRAAVLANEASVADSDGLDAVLNVESVRTLGQATLSQHYTAYTDYVRHRELGLLLDLDLDDQAYVTTDPGADPLVRELSNRREDALDMASTSQFFFLTRYLDGEGSYDRQGELGESWAEAARWQDLNPEAHFAQADQLRERSTHLVGTLIVYAAALWFCALANSIRRGVKYGLGLAGLLGLAAAVLLSLRIEGLV